MSSSWQALSDPNRRAVLELLLERPRPVGELVEQLGLSQPGTSKHLKVLREAGLVQVRQDANRRVYALDPGPIRELDVWLAPYRRLWDESLDELGRHLDRKDCRCTGLRSPRRASPPCASSASPPTPSSASGVRSPCPRSSPRGSRARSRATCARAAPCASASPTRSSSRWTAASSSSTRPRSSRSCGARTCCGSSSRRRATAPG